jgi:hypothetical protein
MNVSLRNQAYEPGELTALKLIYDEITSQPWFRRSDETKKGFAKYLFKTFPAGQFDGERDYSAVEAVARQYCADRSAAGR